MAPRCLAVIPDGTRRYARKQGLSLREGYGAGARTALAMVEWCRAAGVRHLAAFGSSRDNVERRPREDILAIHAAVSWFCTQAATVPGVAIRLFGGVEQLPVWVPERRELSRFVRDGVAPAALVVHVGVNYAAPAHAGIAAREHGAPVQLEPARINAPSVVPAVDLVVRTGGQQRLSGFLPLESAHAELIFLPTLWPELTHAEFQRGLAWYAAQDRRFGE